MVGAGTDEPVLGGVTLEPDIEESVGLTMLSDVRRGHQLSGNEIATLYFTQHYRCAPARVTRIDTIGFTLQTPLLHVAHG